MNCIRIVLLFIIFFISSNLSAQVEEAGEIRKVTGGGKEKSHELEISNRMQNAFEKSEAHDADLIFKKQVYRRLDLNKNPNAALYYPEDIVDGQKNLFRIILELVMDGKIPAYEYLDGREIFSPQYQMNPGDILDRFSIYGVTAKGSTEKNPKYVIEEADVPSGLVKNYYIIEDWEFDRRSSAMKTIVEAICPVLDKYGDYGEETRYPMFWIKMEDLAPYLLQQYVFVNDDNNLPRFSLGDFFKMNLYDGEIYKTKNLRNLSLAQIYPDEDDRKRAQDSIDYQLRNYGKDLWVPTREEYLEMKQAEEQRLKDEGQTEVTSGDIPEKKTSSISEGSSRAQKKKSTKKPKVKTSSSATNTAEKSVRRRKK